MGKWGWLWMSKTVAQLKAYRELLPKDSNEYAEVTDSINMLEQEQAKNKNA